MIGPFDLLAGVPIRGSVLLVLSATVVVLIGLSLLFGAYTVGLRAGHRRRDRRWSRLAKEWQQPVLQAVSGDVEPAELTGRVDPQRRLEFVAFVLEYARRLKGPERERLGALAGPFLDPIAERTWSRFPETRMRAVQTLGTLGLPRFTDEVVDALDDPSPIVAIVAARALCEQGDLRHAAAVIRRLRRFEGWSRSFLSFMLASIGPGAAPTLREALVDEDEAAWVRATAADALRLLRDFDAGDAAADVVELEEDRELLAAALRLLTVVGRPEHVAPVRVRTASPDFVLRALSHSALGSLGSEQDFPVLLRGVEDPSPWVALHAGRALRDAGGDRLLRDLVYQEHERAELARQVLHEEDGA